MSSYRCISLHQAFTFACNMSNALQVPNLLLHVSVARNVDRIKIACCELNDEGPLDESSCMLCKEALVTKQLECPIMKQGKE